MNVAITTAPLVPEAVLTEGPLADRARHLVPHLAAGAAEADEQDRFVGGNYALL